MSSAMSHSLFGCSERLGKQRLAPFTQCKTDRFTLSGEKNAQGLRYPANLGLHDIAIG
jgi:hypothetical protein